MGKKEDLIQGLEQMLSESKAASSTLEFSYELDRIKRRITDLEEQNELIKTLLRALVKGETNE
jgi:hypothetical protein